MKSRKLSFKLKEEFERIGLLQWVHFFFLILATLTEFLQGDLGIFIILKIVFIIYFYSIYNKAKKHIHYSFWTFAFFLAAYFIYQIIHSFPEGAFLFYFAAFLAFLLEVYKMYSPLYYPTVSWWEYDFRYRNDLKIRIKLHDDIFDARLTDLRSHNACIISFEKILLGEKLSIMFSSPDSEDFKLECEAMSFRQRSLGRPYYYGVRFSTENKKDREQLSEFIHFWKSEKRNKIKKKFTSQRNA